MTDRTPKRTRQHVLETLSERHIQNILPPEWICNTNRHDYGFDMSVQLVRGEDVTGREFSIQLKATDHLQVSGHEVSHRCKVRIVNYFLERPDPVRYLVHDAQQ